MGIFLARRIVRVLFVSLAASSLGVTLGCSKEEKAPEQIVIPIPREPIFLRGTFNHWEPRLQFSEHPNKEGAQVAVIRLKPGVHSFKIATESWKKMDLSAFPGEEDLQPNQVRKLYPKGGNFKLTITQEGRYAFLFYPRSEGGPTVFVEIYNKERHG